MQAATAQYSMITKARAALVMGQPFFGALALNLAIKEDASIKTMDVDGVTLRFNPAFAESLPLDQLVAVVAHETLHCALAHPMRRAGRDAKRWNIACDYAVNEIAAQAGFHLPPSALINAAYKGMSADEIYSRLPQDPPGGQGGKDDKPQPGDGVGGCGEFSDAPGDVQADGSAGLPSEATNAKLADDWQMATLQAAQAAKAAGSLPGIAEAMLAAIKHPTVDWKEALRRFMLARVPSDSSMLPPNRRFISRGLYLPSLRAEKLGDIVLAIDTSASIGQAILDQFAGECTAICEELRPSMIHVVYCDARVQKTEQLTPADLPFEFHPVGRGGTRFSPVFDWVEAEGIDPACLVYLTDLECSDFGSDPGYPVLWASIHNGSAPFGEIIRVEAP